MRTMPPRPPKLGRLARLMDGVVNAISPVAGARRRAARLANAEIDDILLGAMAGARSGRFLSGWQGATGSADSDTLDDLPTIRARVRDLCYNNPMADGLLDSLEANIAGNGVRPRAKVREARIPGLNAKRARELEKRMNDAWDRWACGNPDVTGRRKWPGLVQLATRSALEGGDVFVGYHSLPRENRRAPYDFCIELLEADRVSTPTERIDDDAVRGGIRIGQLGQVRGYYVTRRHPGDQGHFGALEHAYRRRFSPSGELQMDQLYWPSRVHQNRGISIFASGLTYFDHLDKLIVSEVVASRVAACISLVVQRNDPAALAAARQTRSGPEAQDKYEELRPGGIEYLSPGEEIKVINAQRPGATWDPTVVRLLRLICRGLDLPYQIGTLDFTGTNYTTSRAAQLETRRLWLMKQEAIVNWGQPIYERVMLEAWLRGELGNIDFDTWRGEICYARWLFPGYGWVDPKKEIESSVLAVKEGFSTFEREMAKWAGDDFEEVVRQRIEEEIRIKELREELGAGPEAGEAASEEEGDAPDDSSEERDAA